MSDRLQKLKRLQASRKGKSKAVDDDDDDRLFDEVDEKEYRDIKRRELIHDDFVVDDDGVGYVDRGVDDAWEGRNDYYSDEDDEDGHTTKKKSSKREGDSKHISDLLRAQHSKNILNSTRLNGTAAKKNMSVDEFDDILGEFDSTTSVKPVIPKVKLGPTKIPSSPTTSSSLKRNIKKADVSLPSSKKPRIDSDPAMQLDSSPLKTHAQSTIHYEDMSDLYKDVENSPAVITTKVEQDNINIVQAEKIEIEEGDDSDDDIQFGRRTMRSVATVRQVNLNSRSNPGTSPFVTAPGTPIHVHDQTPSKTASDKSSRTRVETFGKKFNKEQIVDPETNKFNMFWLDFCEVDDTLVLFGKVKARDGSLLSAMVQVNGLCRELYFLPRPGKTPQDIHEEIIPLLMEKYGLATIRAKPEKRKYAFELPDIPQEADYLKVLLPYKTSKSKRDLIPPDLSSDTFSHVFGGNTNIFESFVVQNKIMGPCWLEIADGDFNVLQNASHCALEVSVSKPQNILPSTAIKDTPGLKCISLSIQTVMNTQDNKQEIVSITLSTFKNILLDVAIPETLTPDEIVTLVKPPQGNSFPPGLATLTKQKLPGQVRLFNSEKTMLACFCAMLKVSDPDVIIGHRLENIFLDVLTHRLFDLKIPTFSSLGRRNRQSWPDKFAKSTSNMNTFYIREIVAGRLLCDISNEMGQSLTPKCQNWTLAEMYQVTCGVDHKPLDINYQNPQYQEDVNTMTMALQSNITDSKIAAEVSFRIQLLSLTKQLTNLAGNAWSQTLGGTRAGRNEYILLHEFTRNGYIIPDKETNKSRAQRQQKIAEEAGHNEGGPLTSSKRAKYQGGLVFEPEKGLHNNYVLVMDFNSLYPSIIQEYNICFTTVHRNLEDIDELPEVPESSKEQGVLPRLLANLVQRRREVKKIMKTETDPHKKIQCDIRQQALKLTANSMYGCLGYVNSRFYAKPLAMLVTNKGREILMNTRQLAESMNLVVVYGDTDSVMISTGCTTYADAIVIGQNFKKLVNERYRLLEIDIDNVFKKLLLHAKKKYAALNSTIDNKGQEHTVLEVKGLDMKRREFCPLSKDVSVRVLETLLSDKDPETALQEIYDYLEEVRGKVQRNEIRVDKFKINTRLSKDPSAYPGGKNMPAVQVALRMRKAGRVVKAGTVITFVITKQESKDSDTVLSPADRAYALTDVLNKANSLKPDPDYYLDKQIFSPVERLLERIESFSVVRLSEALGLDSKKYLRRENNSGSNGLEIDGLQPLETTISDVERFRNVASLTIHCPSCSQEFPFGGVVSSNFYLMCYNGLQCKKCNHLFSALQLTAQLERCIRSHISLYYAGWLYCDDSTCGVVTRQISVFGKRCLNEGCTGVMRYRYSDKQLYNQLLYFNSLFDCEKNKKKLVKPLYHEDSVDFPKDQLADSSILALTEQNRDLFELSQSIVQKYLSDCGRRYVDMSTIFEFMN